jgi:hypothetical protein
MFLQQYGTDAFNYVNNDGSVNIDLLVVYVDEEFSLLECYDNILETIIGHACYSQTSNLLTYKHPDLPFFFLDLLKEGFFKEDSYFHKLYSHLFSCQRVKTDSFPAKVDKFIQFLSERDTT